MTALPELGLGILLAASMPVETLMKILRCDIHAANAFKTHALGDLINLQAQIKRARNSLQ